MGRRIEQELCPPHPPQKNLKMANKRLSQSNVRIWGFTLHAGGCLMGVVMMVEGVWAAGVTWSSLGVPKHGEAGRHVNTWKSQQGYDRKRPSRGTTEARMWLAPFHMLEGSYWPLWRVTLKRVRWEECRWVTIRTLQTLPQCQPSKHLYIVYSREAGMRIRWEFWLRQCPVPESSLHRDLMARWQCSPQFGQCFP